MPLSSDYVRRLAAINVATICFALVGVVRGGIDLPSGQVAWWRAVFAVAAVVVVLVLRRRNPLKLKRALDLLAVLALGLFITGNWYFFFEAIDRATVSVAVIALFTYPLMTALLEPVLFRERVRWPDVAGAVAVVIGVGVLQEDFDLRRAATQGVLYGLASALCLSLANLLSRRMVRRGYEPTQLMFFQFALPAVLLLPAMRGTDLGLSLSVRTMLDLVLLGAVLTTVAQLVFIRSLRHLSTSLASVLLSLQPLYTVVLAWLMLDERPGTRTLVGGAIITASVIAVSAYHARK